jgi:predicted transposase YbfD/YdcC
MQSSSKIRQHFESLRDPRVVSRTDHPLLTVVLMAVIAVIGGAEGWEEIEDFAEDRKDWFAKFLDMPNGVPSESTFYRVFRSLSLKAFGTCMRSWVTSLAECLAGQVVAFDGKTLRGALARSSPDAKLHLVNVWACEQRLLLAQHAVVGAPEEIAGMRDLLKVLELKGALVTADAAHCCRETAQEILDREADYLLHLKANRGAAYEVAVGFFQAAREDDFAGVQVRHSRTEEESHGRVESREAWSIPAKACDLPGEDWPSLRSLTFVERTRTVAQKTTCELHIFLSNLAPSVKRLAKSAREHWQVENGLHWRLDVQMGEDRCAVHEENAAAHLAAMRGMAVTLLLRDDTCRRGKRVRGIAAKRAKAGRNIEYLEHVISLGTVDF